MDLTSFLKALLENLARDLWSCIADLVYAINTIAVARNIIMKPKLYDINAMTYAPPKSSMYIATTARPLWSLALDYCKDISPKISWIEVVSYYKVRYTTNEHMRPTIRWSL